MSTMTMMKTFLMMMRRAPRSCSINHHTIPIIQWAFHRAKFFFSSKKKLPKTKTNKSENDPIVLSFSHSAIFHYFLSLSSYRSFWPWIFMFISSCSSSALLNLVSNFRGYVLYALMTMSCRIFTFTHTHKHCFVVFGLFCQLFCSLTHFISSSSRFHPLFEFFFILFHKFASPFWGSPGSTCTFSPFMNYLSPSVLPNAISAMFPILYNIPFFSFLLPVISLRQLSNTSSFIHSLSLTQPKT